MVDYAKQQEPHKYLFLHCKGVTKPDSKKRKQIKYFIEKGLEIESNTKTDDKVNDFILKDMDIVIHNWLEYSSLLEHNNFVYYIWNFFWVSGKLLHQFEYTEYMKKMKKIGPTNQRYQRLKKSHARHAFALFPIKLYCAKNDIVMTDASEYINIVK